MIVAACLVLIKLAVVVSWQNIGYATRISSVGLGLVVCAVGLVALYEVLTMPDAEAEAEAEAAAAA